MKKTLIFLVLLSVYAVRAQTDEKETLKKINQEIAASFKSKKFDDALKSSRQAVDLSIKIYGAESVETAAVYANLGVIYREKEKYKESIENLQKSADIYQKNLKAKPATVINVYETLAFSQALDGQKKESEASYLQAMKISEEKIGAESKESFSSVLNLANFYVLENRAKEADEMYLKSYAIAIKNFGREAKEIERIENERSCFVSRTTSYSSGLKPFYDERTKRFGELIEQGGAMTAKIKGGLPKPRYNVEANQKRVGGSVAVRVRVDENGDVTEAKAVCGNPLLTGTSEEAIRGAKFEILNVNGKPSKYSGIIFYNYVPR